MKCEKRCLKFLYLFLVFVLVFAAVFLFCTIQNHRDEKIKQSHPEETLPNTDIIAKYPTIIIDAGHGGEDGGTVGINGVLEKNLNLKIAEKLYDSLTSVGIKCVLTRSEDILLYDRNSDYEGHKKALDMQKRLNIANEYENSIFISIHQNSYPAERYKGFQAYYSQNDKRSEELALAFENAIKEKLQPTNNRTAKPSEGKIYLLEHIKSPAVLLECGFLSNSDECSLLCSEEYQDRLVAILSDALLSYISQKWGNS